MDNLLEIIIFQTQTFGFILTMDHEGLLEFAAMISFHFSHVIIDKRHKLVSKEQD